MTQSPCPSDAELSAFHYGDLPAAAVDRVADHLERCLNCDAKLREYDERTDPILHALRQKTVVNPGADDPARHAVTQAHWELTQPPRPATPTDVPGYDVMEQIGYGGMGVVYKARHRKLKRLVALKRLRTSSDWDRERFRTEAEAVARLQHPNIVQIYEVGEMDGLPYLALEYVEGGTLSQLIAGKPQPARPSAELVRTLARAMQYAHEHGVVHRDLKPANILLKTGRTKPRDTLKSPYSTTSLMALVLETTPKIADFGVAKCIDDGSGQTADGDMLGTPSYMAPEQARGRSRQVAPTTDVYALGAILYELTTGRPPFDGEHPLETVHQVLHDDPVSPSRLQPRLPRDLETITLTCLQKDPAKRYQSAGALSDDLDRFLDGRPITARPTPPWERLGRWARRRPREALLAAVALASVLAGLWLVGWQWYRAVADQHGADARALTELAARRGAERREAYLAVDRGTLLCERGEIGPGLLWLNRGLELAHGAGADQLDMPLRIALADWARQIAVPASDAVQAIEAGRVAGSAAGVTVSGDGRWRLTSLPDGSARLWDVADNRQVQDFRHGGQLLTGMAFVPPDGRLILTASPAGGVRVWERDTGNSVGWLAPVWMPAHRLAVSADGQLALVSHGNDARLWDVPGRRPVGHPLPHGARVSAVAFSADGRTCATGDDAGRVRLWGVTTRQPIGSTIDHDSQVLGLRFSADGRRLVVDVAESQPRVWELPNAPTVGLPATLAKPVAPAALSADGTSLLTYGETEAQLWDIEQSSKPAHTYTVGGQIITAAAISADGRFVAIGGATGGLHVLSRNGALIARVPSLSSPIRSICLGADSTRLLALATFGDGAHTSLRRWTVTGAKVEELTWDEPVLTARGSAIQPGGRLLAVGGDSGIVHFLDWPMGKRDGRDVGMSGTVTAMAFSRDGKTLALGGRDGTLSLVDVERRKLLGPRTSSGAPVDMLAFDSGGAVVAAAGGDGVVRLCDVRTGLTLGSPLRHAGAVQAIAFHSDARLVLTVGRDRTLTRWRIPPRPAAGTYEQLRCWADVLAGATLDDDGVVRRLTPDQRHERRERLDQLGGPPKS
jgi:serine/threonine protein kinase/WD40 repeat protein